MSLVGRFLTGSYKVRRTSKGYYVKGRYVAGPVEEIIVDGSLQPTSARELKLPEEGNRLKQYFKFYSDEPILTDSMATLAKGDVVTIDGEEFRAMSLTPWKDTDLDYFMTILWREPEQRTDQTRAG
jgi:hypothetical protein